MALYLLSLVFFLTDIGARLALRAQSWRTVELTLLAGLLLAWLLYPRLSGWAVPLMPAEQGMLLYATLVGLQLGLMDAALRTSLERWRLQRQPARRRRG
ncbi:hypothetical protein KIF53_20750 [Chromobacterium subtsugae]|uniref:Holin n=1 Tax=Chromobacterium subtsugae TaxID=251747 RepID=A0ABS7FJ06_9NEIS|nr:MULTISPECIES: hypothetical protein [Chromobacterium]KUM02242.1 hypothetical protein Cv017_03745 [Chromobacterium subtsugae]KZE86197.1 hypothetical protein AWB61_16810 [Chromobacterium sp. F49]MBW7568044.1 hypothetical protein [Chromobacterium subtsugae]MBW8290074.1 hypothetical protein [Chromobacterium subtsugae]WSE91956.1 hypothetical protein U6115_01560 [Chromobacterium subtsugae]